MSSNLDTLTVKCSGGVRQAGEDRCGRERGARLSGSIERPAEADWPGESVAEALRALPRREMRPRWVALNVRVPHPPQRFLEH